jgi:hypothetical protein
MYWRIELSDFYGLGSIHIADYVYIGRKKGEID